MSDLGFEFAAHKYPKPRNAYNHTSFPTYRSVTLPLSICIVFSQGRSLEPIAQAKES